MKFRNYLVMGLLSGLVLVSCKKDDVVEEVKFEDPYEAEYSDKTIEQNKESMQETGVELVGELSELEDNQAVDVMVNMGDLMLEEDQVSKFNEPMELLASIRDKRINAHDAFQALKSAAEEDDPTLSEAWAEVAGKYTYNFNTEDWDYTENSNAIIIEFPGMDTDKTNTANLTIDNFKYKTIVDDYELGTTQLPTSLNASLKYEGTELFSYSFSASFESDGMPLSVKSTLKIGGFSLSVDFSNTPYTKVGYTGEFKHDDKILIAEHLDFEGDWSASNIEDNIEEHKEFWYVDSWTGDSVWDEWVEVYIENIIQEANAYVQVLNMKVVGKVDIKNLGTEVRAFEEKYDEEEEFTEAMAKEMVAIINKNVTLVVVYAETNQKIALAEAFTYEDEYGDWEPNIQFIFADGSKMDPETFVEEGFTDLVKAMNDFIDDLNAAYDLDLEKIDY